MKVSPMQLIPTDTGPVATPLFSTQYVASLRNCDDYRDRTYQTFAEYREKIVTLHKDIKNQDFDDILEAYKTYVDYLILNLELLKAYQPRSSGQTLVLTFTWNNLSLSNFTYELCMMLYNYAMFALCKAKKMYEKHAHEWYAINLIELNGDYDKAFDINLNTTNNSQNCRDNGLFVSDELAKRSEETVMTENESNDFQYMVAMISLSNKLMTYRAESCFPLTGRWTGGDSSDKKLNPYALLQGSCDATKAWCSSVDLLIRSTQYTKLQRKQMTNASFIRKETSAGSLLLKLKDDALLLKKLEKSNGYVNVSARLYHQYLALIVVKYVLSFVNKDYVETRNPILQLGKIIGIYDCLLKTVENDSFALDGNHKNLLTAHIKTFLKTKRDQIKDLYIAVETLEFPILMQKVRKFYDDQYGMYVKSKVYPEWFFYTSPPYQVVVAEETTRKIPLKPTINHGEVNSIAFSGSSFTNSTKELSDRDKQIISIMENAIKRKPTTSQTLSYEDVETYVLSLGIECLIKSNTFSQHLSHCNQPHVVRHATTVREKKQNQLKALCNQNVSQYAVLDDYVKNKLLNLQ